MKQFLFVFIFFANLLPAAGQSFNTDSVPVRIGFLNAVKINNTTRLNWEVTCLLEYANFDIQRSADAIHYTSVNIFNADKLRCRQPFNYDDNTVSGTVYYRIRVGDLDGRYYSSKVVAVYNKTKGFNITGFYPSVVHSKATLTLSTSAATTAKITITNLQGNAMRRVPLMLAEGSNEISLDLSILSKGAYILSVATSAETTSRTTLFIKQ
jgi:Secretion system C-terminal sorting domain